MRAAYRVLRGHGVDLRRTHVVLRRLEACHRVLLRLADRIFAEHRQPVRVCHYHVEFRGAEGTTEIRAVSRHHRRARTARHVHFGGRCHHLALHLGVLPIRRVPHRHGHQTRRRGRRGRGIP